MGKGSGGTRNVDKTHKGKDRVLSPLIGGSNDPELTDSIRDYFLPQSVREKLGGISELRTFRELREYFKERGIELTTDNERLKTELGDSYIKTVAETGQKLAVAVETYRDLFGKDALSKLNKIVLGRSSLDSTASFHYNEPGENDPLAGTLLFRGFDTSGYIVYHELAHAFQYSKTRSGESLQSASARMIKSGQLSPKVKAYFGASRSDGGIDVERMADAMGHGFAQGSKNGLAFIENLRKAYRK